MGVMKHSLFTLDVRLEAIRPPIWRTLELPGTATLEEVHLALQAAMGWTNSHLHAFTIGQRVYGMADIDHGEREVEDERAFRLQELVREGDRFRYEYDFGDGWRHAVSVTKVSAVGRPPAPRCIAGQRACPPEDCGGPPGYEHLLAVLADPSHPEHDELVEWSDGFEPEAFALPKQGVALRDPIARLQSASGDTGDEDEDDGADLGEGDLVDATATRARPAAGHPPAALVQAALALPALPRAALAAIITQSLALDALRASAAAPAPPRATGGRRARPAPRNRGRRS